VVVAKLKELNPGFDDKVTHKIASGVVTELQFSTNNVTDISPVRALIGLRTLNCGVGIGMGQLADLSPLKGMKLVTLNCLNTSVSDLSPLKDMQLTSLTCANTHVSDLSPLKGMKLTFLSCSGRVSDLSPLREMPLKAIHCGFKPERDAEILRSIKTLETINLKPAAEFWKEVGAKKPSK
jgi:Leucine-rich repeat (LRR) protein